MNVLLRGVGYDMCGMHVLCFPGVVSSKLFPFTAGRKHQTTDWFVGKRKMQNTSGSPTCGCLAILLPHFVSRARYPADPDPLAMLADVLVAVVAEPSSHSVRGLRDTAR